MGKTLANLLLLLRSSSNDATKESTMIHNFVYATKINDIYETNLIMLEIRTLILMDVMCCYKLMSIVVYCCHYAKHC